MSWLSTILAPLRLFLNGVEQTRDDRVNFRYGFTGTQVPDADGVNMLTLDTETGAATVLPTADKVVKRNGSGAAYATTFVGTSFAFATPRTISFKEHLRILEPAAIDPVTGWSINGAQDLEANAVDLQWLTEITPPVGSVLKTISAVYTPPRGHGGYVAVADQPSIELFVIDEGVPPGGAFDSAQDDAADLVAYETKRTLTLTLGAPLTIAADKRYWVQFNTEGGANKLAGTELHVAAKWTAEIAAL